MSDDIVDWGDPQQHNSMENLDPNGVDPRDPACDALKVHPTAEVGSTRLSKGAEGKPGKCEHKPELEPIRVKSALSQSAIGASTLATSHRHAFST